jgi:transposase
MSDIRRKPGTASKITSPDNPQFALFGDAPSSSTTERLSAAASSERRFVTGDAEKIFIGPTRLRDYLQQADQKAPFIVADLLDQQDWTVFENRYAPTGRPPYSPRAMLGLILVGVMQGLHSLRELERLARLDLGCMWVTGGIMPDHANIGRFIVMHEESITKGFFESLTRSILKKTGAHSNRLAGDGTVIEAACSHYNLLKEEALLKHVAAAKKDCAGKDGGDDQPPSQDEPQMLQILEQRKNARKRSGRSTDTLSISPTEPEAMVQRLKRGKGLAASYKPSVLANENRIITAMEVDPSSETKVIGTMLDQSARIVGAHAQELLLDAGYFDDGVIAATLERDVSLLCPDGQRPGILKASKVFPKSSFHYDASTDTYRCPVGALLKLFKVHPATSSRREHSSYVTDACANCASRANCTTTKRRRINRHAEDEQRDALREVMQQKQVRGIFSKRQAMVEPVFSHLRGQQGLHRFRRRGLKAVKREFALHVLAYNMARAVALLRALAFACRTKMHLISGLPDHSQHFLVRLAALFRLTQKRSQLGAC